MSEPPAPTTARLTADEDGHDFPFEPALARKSSTPASTELTVGRHATGRPGPDIDLADVPRGRTVSRRHARLTRRADEWFLLVEDGTSNPTQVDGQAVEPGVELALADGQQIQFGGVALHFREPNPVRIVGDERIGVKLEPEAIAAAPGSAYLATVTVTNFTSSVQNFRVELFGLPASWYQLVLPSLKRTSGGDDVAPPDTDKGLERTDLRLFQTESHDSPASDAIGTVLIWFSPPRTPSATAGDHHFTVRVTSLGKQPVRRELKVTLVMEQFQGLSVHRANADPHRRSGTFDWIVQNTGNAPAVVRLAARAGAVRQGPLAAQLALLPPETESAEQDQARSEVELAWPPQLSIGHGAQQLATVTARVRHRPWWGDARMYPIMVTATAGTASAFDRAYLPCAPRVPPAVQAILRWLVGHWWLLVIVLVVLVLLWPTSVNLTVTDRELTATEPVDNQVHEVAAGDEVFLKLTASFAKNETVDGATYNTLRDPSQECVRHLGPVEVPKPVCEYVFGTTRWLPQNPLESTTYVLHGGNIMGLPSGGDDWPLVVRPAPEIDSFEASTLTLSREGEAVTLKWKLRAVPNDDMHVYLRRQPAQTAASAALPADQVDPCTNPIKRRLVFEALWLDVGGYLRATLRNVCHVAVTADPRQVVVGSLPPLPVSTEGGATGADLKPGQVLRVCVCASPANDALATAFQRPGTPVQILSTSDGKVMANGTVFDQVYPPPGITGVLDTAVAVPQTTASANYVLEAWSRWTRVTPALARRTVVVTPPTIDVLMATPTSAASGAEVRLQWSVKGATSLALFGSTAPDQDGDQLINSDTAPLLTSASWAVSVPTVDQPTDYWLTLVANNVATLSDPSASSVRKKLKIALVPAQVFFRAEPDTLPAGDTTTLIWQADQALAVRVDPTVGEVPLGAGRAQLKPPADTTYTMTVTGLDGVETRKIVQVHVQQSPEPTPAPVTDTSALAQASLNTTSIPPRIDFFQAAPATVEAGQSTRLVFSVHAAQHIVLQDADGVVIVHRDSDDGAQIVQNVEVQPTATTVFALTASSPAGEVTQPLAIEVHAPIVH